MVVAISGDGEGHGGTGLGPAALCLDLGSWKCPSNPLGEVLSRWSDLGVWSSAQVNEPGWSYDLGVFGRLKVFRVAILDEGTEERSEDRAGNQENNTQRRSQCDGMTRRVRCPGSQERRVCRRRGQPAVLKDEGQCAFRAAP